ncbi:MAG: hypothetical protein H6Q15_2273 [Bacteroidetes bacterium]|nr:hypothetical protein [Bacteroidota bacterium]
MRKIIILILFFLPSILQAQTESPKSIIIDMTTGINVNLFEPKFGNASDCLLSAKTISPFIKGRFSYFFSSRWGAFVNLKIASATYSGKDYSNMIPNLYYNLGDDFKENNTTILHDGSIGGTYRIENKNWSIRTRLGIGIGEMLAKSPYFTIKEKGNNNLYYIKYTTGDTYMEVDELPFLNPGISLSYKYDDDILFNVDINYTQFIQKTGYTYYLTDAYTQKIIEKRKFAPKNLSGNLEIGLGVSFSF